MSDHPPCAGCPHPDPPYVHAHQRWNIPGPHDRGREQLMPWETPAFKATHPGSRRDRALAWLRETFAR